MSVMIAVVTIGLVGYFWISNEFERFKKESAALRKAYIEEHRQVIRNETEKAIDYIEFKKSQAENRLKSFIKNRAEEGHAIAMGLYHQYHGKMDPADVEKIIIEALRPIRFNENRGYFFATRLDGVAMLYPDRPKMEGKNIFDMQDAKGRSVIRDMIDLIRAEGKGFYQYTWAKPNRDGKDFPKIAYLIHMEPLNCFIGTGEYLDDFVLDIQQEVCDRINRIRFEGSGYIFAGQFDGFSLIGPAAGQYLIDIMDMNGVKVVQELILTAKSGGGFVSYIMPKLNGVESYPKLSYTKAVKDWKWYVGAGIDVGSIDSVIALKRVALQNRVKDHILNIVWILVSILGLILLAVKFFSDRIRKSFDLMADFFLKAATESTKIDHGKLHFTEFEQLAITANQMVAQRGRAEDALRESERQIRLLMDSTAEAIYGLDMAGLCTFANPACVRLLGYRHADEIVGKQMHELIHHTTADGNPCPIEECRILTQFQNGHGIHSDTGIMWRTDGTSFSAEYWSYPIHRQDRIIGAVVTFFDITERKRTADALRRERDRAQMYLDIAGVMFIALNKKGEVTLVNKKGCEILGREEKEILGKNWFDHFLPDETKEKVRETYYLLLSGDQEPTEYFENPIRIKGDETRDMAWHNTPLKDETGSIVGTFSSGEDITVRKRMNKEKGQLEVQLQQALKMEAIGTLAGGIAHDFNNILSAILGYSEIALFSIPDKSKARGNIDQVLKAGYRARDLVKQILAFSRQGELEQKPIQIQYVVKEALKLLRSSLPATIEIQQNISTKPGSIMADLTRIHQVLMNLCTNALHALQEDGGVLEIGVQDVRLDVAKSKELGLVPGGHVVLSVRDTGCGMDRSMLDHIFNPYFTTKDKDVGTGMGLAVVHGIVKEHGGAITVDSEPGKGSLFNVYFPKIIDEDKGEERTVLPMPGGDERILFVDDEKPIIDFGRILLQKLGYEVTTKTCPLEALDEFKYHPDDYDLVITDFTMPKMTGDRLAEELMAIRPGIPIILCTGFSERISEEIAADIGIKGFVMKPIVIRELSEIIRKILGK